MGKFGKYTYVDHKYDEKTGRTIIVLKKDTWWGLSSVEELYIDTKYVYSTTKRKVFMTYPDMIQLDNSDDRVLYLGACLKKIEYERTGEIKLNCDE